ncbi:MAG: hypothetical protein IJU76_03785 [Desulfovibrionaceae bacterium]|nr:hypothetical protein [Desulfovibrionaceae bacterium]
MRPGIHRSQWIVRDALQIRLVRACSGNVFWLQSVGTSHLRFFPCVLLYAILFVVRSVRLRNTHSSMDNDTGVILGGTSIPTAPTN